MSHKIYTNKYKANTTQFSNPAAMVVALCEKAISCISTARIAHEQNDNIAYCKNLGIVQEIIHLISATLDSNPNDPNIKEVQKFYMQLSLYTSALIADQIDFEKSKELLEAFRITRDTWKSVEQRYLELKNNSDNATTDGSLI